MDRTARPRRRHAALLLLSLAAPSLAGVSVTSLTRQLELGGSVARGQTTLQLTSDGRGLHEDASLTFSPDEAAVKTLSWLDAVETKSKQALLVTTDGQRGYQVVIPTQLASLGNFSVTVSEVYTHASTPRPKQLEQAGQEQLMLWSGDLLAGFGVGRTVKDVRVRVKTPTPNVPAHSTPAGWSATHTAGSSTIVYTGSLDAGRDTVPATVHYEQPAPVVALRKLRRHIEVSHWADNVAFQDEMQLVNDGPALKGFFSRLTHSMQGYMRSSTGYNHVLAGIIITLPAGVTSPYFVDTVGNVSTSHFRPASSTVARNPRARQPTSTLEVRPRYPLFGGWKYDFTIGYDAPLRSHLRRIGDGSYLLAVPFLTASKDMAIDDAEVRIVLPEGATDVHVYPPFPASPRLVTHKTYLDTTGRPTVVLSKRICSDRHALDVLVSYRYSTTALLQKPLAVASVAFALFLSGIGLRRVTWQIERRKVQ